MELRSDRAVHRDRGCRSPAILSTVPGLRVSSQPVPSDRKTAASSTGVFQMYGMR